VLDDDYIKLLGNLKYYLGQKMTFDRYGVDPHSNYRYPVFRLDDIEIHCNHAESVESALADWNRRVGLVNWDNLFVEMYTDRYDVAKKFDDINLYDRMVCFVPMEMECSKLHKSSQIAIMPGQVEFWEAVNSSATIGKNGMSYNLVDLLLHGKVVRRLYV
jgi:uncharacterized protein (DUF1919 family)